MMTTSRLIELYGGAKGAEMVVSVDVNGKVTYGKGFTADAASHAFWEAIGKHQAAFRLAEKAKEAA